MLTVDYSYRFHKAISTSARIGFFYSIGQYEQPFYSSFSAISPGLYLNHIVRFSEDKSFVRTSAGIAYFNSYAYWEDSNTHTEIISKLGYGLSLEGGGRVSEKVDLGLLLSIYSYQIFGDIIVLGVNAHFRL
jgi:hypothetical protein